MSNVFHVIFFRSWCSKYTIGIFSNPSRPPTYFATGLYYRCYLKGASDIHVWTSNFFILLNFCCTYAVPHVCCISFSQVFQRAHRDRHASLISSPMTLSNYFTHIEWLMSRLLFEIWPFTCWIAFTTFWIAFPRAKRNWARSLGAKLTHVCMRS